MAEIRHLLETPRLVVGEFRCLPGDPAWFETNRIGDWPHVVFPLVPVLISQADGEPVLTTSNHAIFYDAGRRYRRGLGDAQGDRCVFFSVRPDELPRCGRAAIGPSAAGIFLAQHVIVRGLRAGRLPHQQAEALALGLVRRSVARLPPPRRGGRPQTRAGHARLAELAKAELWRSLGEPLPLAELAGRLRCSPYHLARVFRAETGFSVDRYHRALRLRAALERLPAHSGRLSALALDLGFSSHSHFSDTFRREFGVAPSALR